MFDGVDVDAGTAGEKDVAYARGQRVFGPRTDSQRTGVNEAAIVNLQVRHWIDASGGSPHTRVADLIGAGRALVRGIARPDAVAEGLYRPPGAGG